MNAHSARNDQRLRAALKLEGVLIGEHRKKVAEIGRSIAHTITYVESAEGANCVTYTLGLVSHPNYRSIARTGIFAGTDFINWLLAGRRLDKLSHPAAGVVVLYFNNDRWTHLGVITASGEVLSKWGEFPVYQHGLWEVPASYGQDVKYFRLPNEEEVLRLFQEFADEQAARS